MALARKTVLAIGLKGITPELNADPSITKWTPEQVAKSAKEQVDKLQQSGVDLTPVFFDASDDTINAEVAKMYNSQHWDVVLVGGGLRMLPACAQKFQDITNVVMAKGQNPAPKFVFPNGPDEMYERVTRILSQ